MNLRHFVYCYCILYCDLGSVYINSNWGKIYCKNKLYNKNIIEKKELGDKYERRKNTGEK